MPNDFINSRSTQGNANHCAWTPASLEALSPICFPFSKTGPLCPLLDDEELLLDIYGTGQTRHDVKRLFKARYWPGKPPLPVILADKTLKPLLRSACNSPEGRIALASVPDLALHNAIWNWVRSQDSVLTNEILKHCHKGSDERFYLTPDEFRSFLTVNSDIEPEKERLVILLGIAFAILEMPLRFELISELLAFFPETESELGISYSEANKYNEQLDIPVVSVSGDKTLPLVTSDIDLQAANTLPEKTSSIDQTLTSGPFVASEDKLNSLILGAPVHKCLQSQMALIASYAEKLVNTSQLFANELRLLAEDAAPRSLVDVLKIDQCLQSLQGTHRFICEMNENFFNSLQFPYTCAVKDGCALPLQLEKIRTSQLSCFDEFGQVAEKIRCAIKEIEEDKEAVFTEFEALTLRANNLSIQVPLFLLSDSELSALPPCSLRSLRNQTNEVVTKHERLVKERFEKERQIALDRVSGFALDVESSGESLNAVLNNILTKAQNLIEFAKNASEIEEAMEKFSQAVSEWETENHGPAQTAAALVNGTIQTEQFLDFCESLLADNKSELAFLAFYLCQERVATGIVEKHVDRALSLFLTSACKAALGGLAFGVVWQGLCSATWLQSLEPNDIQSVGLNENLQIAFLGGVLCGNSSTATNLLLKFGASDSGRRGWPEFLKTLMHAVVTQRVLRRIDCKEIENINDLKEKISEQLARDGKKYRHIQCPEAKHYARFEATRVFPALSDYWSEISQKVESEEYSLASQRCSNISVENWFESLKKNHDDRVPEHSHYIENILSFMRDFLGLVKEYVLLIEATYGQGNFIFSDAELKDSLMKWARSEPLRINLVQLIAPNVTCQHSAEADHYSIWKSCLECLPVISKAPNFILKLIGSLSPTMTELGDVLVNDIASNFSYSDVIAILDSNYAWKQAAILSEDTNREQEDLYLHKHDLVMQQLKLDSEHLSSFDITMSTELKECLDDGRLGAARLILIQSERKKEQLRLQKGEVIRDFIAAQLGILTQIKNMASEANMSESWQDKVYGISAKIERKLMGLKSLSSFNETGGAQEKTLERCVSALKYFVEQKATAFDEIRSYLENTDESDGTSTNASYDLESSRNSFPNLFGSWDMLCSSSSIDEVRRDWNVFVREFAKLCNLYHDEKDEKKRFLTVPSINYPFTVFHTSFYKPQSEFLKRPLRLYLYRSSEVDTQALQRLEAAICGEEASTRLHIVFVAQGIERIGRYFKYDRGFKNFLLADEKFLGDVVSSEKHDVPLRQALNTSVADITNSSPFVAQGYCHQSNNIYVGRNDVLLKLLNTPQAMIWGGRRIGKTSVLHALEQALVKRGFQVAYVYVDIESNGDPDLAVARKICSTLQLDEINNITDFERQISARRNGGEKFAFLIDEVDEYIKKSRSVHGDSFPLASALRGLAMDDKGKETRLVYSGYHQLYFEAKIDGEKRRVSHPFVNVAQAVPIVDLNFDDVIELVRRGFEEMLGIHLEPEVPRAITSYASRHPAFVQQFCRCLLDRVSKRRAPGRKVVITKEDVDAVYYKDVSREDGEQPFIFYINETLGYNLSHLGRAVMLAISLQNIDGDYEAYRTKREIEDELNLWCNLVGVEPPSKPHFEQTIDLLVMTNMLTQDSSDSTRYRVTYPSFIDILRRLDKLGKTAIDESLKAYDGTERACGVLL